MRIHTALNGSDVTAAARMAGVQFERCSLHKSRTHTRAYDVILSGSNTRRRNTGTSPYRTDDYAATWDEWGIFLAELFRRDPQIKCAYYRDAADFHWQTGNRFKTLRLVDQHRTHNWSYSMTLQARGCACGAVMRHPR